MISCPRQVTSLYVLLAQMIFFVYLQTNKSYEVRTLRLQLNANVIWDMLFWLMGFSTPTENTIIEKSKTTINRPTVTTV